MAAHRKRIKPTPGPTVLNPFPLESAVIERLAMRQLTKRLGQHTLSLPKPLERYFDGLHRQFISQLSELAQQSHNFLAGPKTRASVRNFLATLAELVKLPPVLFPCARFPYPFDRTPHEQFNVIAAELETMLDAGVFGRD